jgi:histone acetyltransferase MYST1
MKVTRRFKRKLEENNHVTDDHGGDHGHEKEHHSHKVKTIQVVEFGRFEMDTWYYSPYPEPYSSQHKLYICEYTLKYFRKKKTLIRHLAKLDLRHPPGDEIYRSPPPPLGQPNFMGGAVTSPPISVFEVDGKKAKVYCQNLCLLSKLFLDHKTLYYDVDPFLFYVMCERDEAGYHMVGYFSKEKQCMEEYNLACILTLPCYQRRGYGKFLIAFAYELSRREGRVGTPERPLSDLGLVSFRSYWTKVLLEHLRTVKGDVSIKEVSDATMIRGQDIVETLTNLGMIKYWKGTHLIHGDPKVAQDHLSKLPTQVTIDVDPTCLHWQPMLAAPSRKRP